MMHTIYKLLPALLFCLSTLLAAPFEFQHYSTSDGLSSSKVTCITQDERGYMWFGTYDGLNRFDGSEFVTFRHQDSDIYSISGNAVRALLCDSAQRLWICTTEGVNLYDPSRDRFVHFPDPDKNAVHAMHIVETPDQDILVVAPEDLFKIDLVDSSCVRQSSSALANALRNNWGPTDLLVDDSGILFMTSSKMGLTIISPTYEPITSFNAENGARKGLQTNSFRHVVADEFGNLWLASRNGLYYFDRETDKFILYQHDPKDPASLARNACFSLYMDADQNLWVALTNGGINLKRKGADGFEYIHYDPKNSRSLNSDAVQTIFVDDQKNVWVGTLNGISVAYSDHPNIQTFRHYPEQPNSLSNNNVKSFAEDGTGNLWITTDGGGLNCFDRQRKTFRHFRAQRNEINAPQSNALLCCLYEADDKLWIGGYLSGLSCLSLEQQNFKHVLHSTYGELPLRGDVVQAILRDRQNDLWVATIGDGLFRFIHGRTADFKHYISDPDTETSLPINQCTTLFEDSRGDLWIGTYAGLCRFDRSTERFIVYQDDRNDPFSLNHNWINAVHEDQQQRLWVGTPAGLNLFDRQTDLFTVFTTDHGLPGDVVNSILEDDHGRLWISTNNGIARFSADMSDVVVYTQTDGLQGNEFIRGAALKLSTGEMVFGGVNGFSIFYPDSLSESQLTPPVLLHKVEFLNQPDSDSEKPREQIIAQSSEIVLTRKQSRTFRIHYNAIEYKAPDKIRYYYRLDGYDKNWVSNGINRTITFMNLSPGTYTLNIAAVAIHRQPDENFDNLKLKILPGWWETPFAFLGYFLALAGLFLIYHLNSKRFMHLRIALKTQMVEKEKAQELETLKSQFFTNISHEFRTPLTLILVPLRELLRGKQSEELSNQFKLMKRSAERLLRLVNQVIDMNKLEAGRLDLFQKEIDLVAFVRFIVETFEPLAKDKKIALTFSSASPHLYSAIDPDKIDMVIFNVLSNAFKFTPDKGEISVTLQQEGEMVHIEVQDSGPGIPDEHLNFIFDRFYHVDHQSRQSRQGAGIGLALSKELVEMHGGTLSAQNCAVGALFTIKLPYAATIHPVRDIAEPHVVPMEEPVFIDSSRGQLEMILIVEDDADLRYYLTTQLQTDYKVKTAGNGRLGLEMAQKHMPQLVLSDVMMPELTGIELCEKLKTNQLTSHIPIILLTAKSSEMNHVEGLEIGADDYLTKPFNLEILKARIRNLLNNRRKLREQFSERIQLSSKEIGDSMDEAFIQKAVHVVEKNIDNVEFSVEAFGKALGLSRSQLFRKLKALTNETPVGFIQLVRLKRAEQLLSASSQTVTEIAYDVGFNYPNNFARIFQKRFGLSPSDYRKKHASS